MSLESKETGKDLKTRFFSKRAGSPWVNFLDVVRARIVLPDNDPGSGSRAKAGIDMVFNFR